MSHVDIFDQDPTKDLARTREIDIGKPNTIKIICSDPFGFWNVEWYQGTVPKELTGAYTSYDKAKAAVELWLKNNIRITHPETEISTVAEAKANKTVRKKREQNRADVYSKQTKKAAM